jgi:C4-dicarboxylate transporter, DctM subunit
MPRRITSLAVLLLLLAPLSLACAQLLHARMLVWGNDVWPGYAMARAECVAQEDPTPPSTDAAEATAGAATTANEAPGADDDELDDMLDDDDDEAAPNSDADELDDMLDDDDGDDGEPAKPKPAVAAPKPDADADELDDMLDDDDDEVNSAPTSASATGDSGDLGSPGDHGDAAGSGTEALSAVGTAEQAGQEATAAPIVAPKMTSGLRTYCTIERRLATASEIGVGWMATLMVLLLLTCAFIATARRHHIALRNPRSVLEDRVSNIAQICGNAFVGFSAWHMRTFADPGADRDRQVMWTVGMAALVFVNVIHIIKPVAEKPGTKTGIGRAIACIPLYTWMAIISGIYFMLLADKSHPAGVAIYLGKITEFSILYIQVGLYLWTGMLLRDTRLGELMFDVLRPLKLPTDLFAVLVVVMAAVPTAYSGASGILVLALGATIYTELRRSGASQQRALAATAMSGSLGVVLPPCLLVVIVASINLDVTTDELFHWGWRVFFLTTTMFALVSFALRKTAWTFKPQPGAGGESMKAVRGLLPYLGIALAVIAFFWLALNAVLDEHTAPYVLPVALLAIIPWDRVSARRAAKSETTPKAKPETSLDTGTHIGALLMLMGLSACLGGVIESAEIVELFPQDAGSPLVAMSMLMVVLVLIGMVMDPYGAVILVSVTLYPIAKLNGIHPLNFWMTALVSFELGYLTPPVALNHPPTRQVVQHLPEYDEDEEIDPSASFVERHERLLVPITVLTVTLLTVALGPILYGVTG